MLDLSVSWVTSDPVFKKLGSGPRLYRISCAITNYGEDVFVLSQGTGHFYNVKSDSWTPFPNTNFATVPPKALAASEPNTRIIYIPDGGTDLTGKKVMLSVDPVTKTVSSTGFNLPVFYDVIAWSRHLESMFVSNGTLSSLLFTPTNVTGSSDGWSVLKTERRPGTPGLWTCSAPAYDGLMMIFIGLYLDLTGSTGWSGSIYMLDVEKGIWAVGPPPPNGFRSENCAVSGDYFIAWGYTDSTTLVFDLKTQQWVSRYIAPPSPPPRPPTTTNTLKPSHTATPKPGNLSSGVKNLVSIIVTVTGTLLATVLGLIF
ncbi:hypothetical protein BGX34_002857 [Mortierella sp. NVP85]|nr:hypothetical protein BGX34_002857 [Mortierella sp. NVP85]